MAGSRLVLLGASNAARGCLGLIDAARSAIAGPVEVHAALGRGRSFGIRSRLLGRQLGGIDDCGIWSTLATAPPVPTTALVMDVGNDLFYGVEVARVLSWVDGALARLAPRVQRLRLAGIPLLRLARLRPWQYAVFRAVLVPSCRLELADGLKQAAELHAGLERLARQHGAEFVVPEDAWYGVDPIHIRRRHWPAAARVLLGVDSSSGSPAPLDRGWSRLGLLLARPERRWWFGREQRAVQPARRYADGTTLSLW